MSDIIRKIATRKRTGSITDGRKVGDLGYTFLIGGQHYGIMWETCNAAVS